ncbi:hypothetical protein QFC19_000990 [Naganishia cerealis]|uniref:Uncharacterized protein n=1 Tax=Naganishia cerealis TaxID=610337 RepID=A0ACC2WK86_9TREE|nr:hypothetical protein QFC19_000990 [Naganishia cerealis]
MKEPDVSGAIQHRIRPSIDERHQRLLSGLRLESGAPRWEKALWNRHPEYEDNYVPSDFLASTKAKFEATTSDSIWPLAGGLFMLSSILGGFGGDYQDDETQEADEEDEGLSATSPVASNRTVVMSPMLKRGMRKRRASAASLTAPEVESPQEKAKMWVSVHSADQ